MKKDREYELTKELVRWNISFNPPISKAAQERLKIANPEAYEIFCEFMELKKKEKKNG